MSSKIVAFGEILLRLTPESKQLIPQVSSFNACYGGSESNVLVCLANLGNQTEFITALPNNSLGYAATKHLRSYGVDTSNIVYTNERLGVYYLEEGVAERSAKVIYDRQHSAVSLLTVDSFDFEKVFKDCSLFHISGISFALSETTKELCFQLIREAKKREIPVSFDFNYRRKLWTPEEATRVYKKIVPLCDIVFAATQDINEFLGVSAKTFFDVYPCTTLFIREREVISPERNIIRAIGYRSVNGQVMKTAPQKEEFAVYERIGSGDAFAGGILHILNKEPDNIEKALSYGMSCMVLKHSLTGDVFTLNEDAVIDFLNRKRNDINR